MEYPYDQDTMQKRGLVMTFFILLLPVIFIVLKVMAVITWGWLWVFVPFWGPMLLGFILRLCGIKPPGMQ